MTAAGVSLSYTLLCTVQYQYSGVLVRCRSTVLYESHSEYCAVLYSYYILLLHDVISYSTVRTGNRHETFSFLLHDLQQVGLTIAWNLLYYSRPTVLSTLLSPLARERRE